MRVMRALAALMIMSFMLACATTQADKERQRYEALATSAAAVDGLGAQMIQVNSLFVVKCLDKTLSAKTCNDFIKFGEKFKLMYGPTVQAWKASRGVSDIAVRGSIENVVVALTTELVKFGATVGLDVYTNLSKK